MDIIRKQRVNYTVTTTLIAAVFLLIVLGGLFGVVYGSNDVFINKAIEKALADPVHYNDEVANDLRCIFIYSYGNRRQHRRLRRRGKRHNSQSHRNLKRQIRV